jgi:2-polyprenyl-3-methyl-5-hydroxy-6-metoxy-1,4-benzoquinol methylase
MALRKPLEYYDTARTDLIPHLPRPLGRVLDIGCHTGRTGRLLRPLQPERLVGIEINAEAAEVAKSCYDEVLVGPAEEIVPALRKQFDTILCYDVLEHMMDPWHVLDAASRISPAGGRLHVSVPNARHLSLVFDLVFRGTFNYQPWGHRDNTHLRWFTPRDLEAAIRDAGFEIQARSHPEISAFRRSLGAVTRGRSTEFLVWQWQVLAIRSQSQ